MQYKTTKTTVSIGIHIKDQKIMEAKTYLKKEFNNKYDIEPHFNFVIMAMPENKLKEMETALNNYFKNKPTIELELGELHYEPKTKFFSVPIIGTEIMKIHEDLLATLNPIRDNHIREKDLIRMQEGRTSKKEEEYIEKFGYLRVLDLFTPHITIGNLQIEHEIDIDVIKNKLNTILKDLYNKKMPFNKIYTSFMVDAEIQSDYKLLWEKEYTLK